MKLCKKKLHYYASNLGRCLECKKHSYAVWHSNNIERRKAGYAAWYQKNKEYKKAYAKRMQKKTFDRRKATTATWRANNAKRYLKAKSNRDNERRNTDPLYRLRRNLSSLIRRSIIEKGYSKASKSQVILGADFRTVNAHLIKTAIMTYGKYFPRRHYHVDHIIPISLAKSELDLIKLNHYTNLQYLYPADNLKKSNKLGWDV